MLQVTQSATAASVLDGDTVVLALGQKAELSLLDGVPGVTISDGVVQIGRDLMTGRPGIFAGGTWCPPTAR